MPDKFTTADWDGVEALVLQRYPRFYHDLEKQHPKLTLHEINLCSLLVLKRDRLSIAEAFDISPESLKTKCSRLRHHAGIPSEEVLEQYLLKIAHESEKERERERATLWMSSISAKNHFGNPNPRFVLYQFHVQSAIETIDRPHQQPEYRPYGDLGTSGVRVAILSVPVCIRGARSAPLSYGNLVASR